MERLQKVLAGAGVGSRRTCEEIIAEGRVTVNGDVVPKMGVLVDPEEDDIRCDGVRVKARWKVYYLLNKPRGYICSQSDEYGRKRAVDLLVGVKERVFPVGRLDKESQGLLLFTNDGDLANRITHPRFGVPKTYLASVKGRAEPSAVEDLKTGLHLAEGKVKADQASIHSSDRDTTTFEITLTEGRNREIRRMLAQLGYKVKRLKRTRIANLTDRGLGVGKFRPVSREEAAELQGGIPATPAPLTPGRKGARRPPGKGRRSRG